MRGSGVEVAVSVGGSVMVAVGGIREFVGVVVGKTMGGGTGTLVVQAANRIKHIIAKRFIQSP
jgi:hypothetical protein